MECIVCTGLLDKSISACIPCGHVFHLDCLGTWLSEHNNCPMCRKGYNLTHMLILYLPKDDVENNNEDEEIKRKWEIYTISAKVDDYQIQTTNEEITEDPLSREQTIQPVKKTYNFLAILGAIAFFLFIIFISLSLS